MQTRERISQEKDNKQQKDECYILDVSFFEIALNMA